MNFWYIQTTGTPKEQWITTRKVRAYRDTVMIGSLIDGPRGKRIRVLKKYRHFAMTNIGTQSWVDLYMFNVRQLDCTETGYMFNKR